MLFNPLNIFHYTEYIRQILNVLFEPKPIEHRLSFGKKLSTNA